MSSLEIVMPFLQKEDYLVELNKKFEGLPRAVDVYATKQGHNLARLKLLASCDYIFFHDLNNSEYPGETLKIVHDAERDYVNGLFKIPRPFRLKVPNIVTVFVSSAGFSEEQISYVQKPTNYDNVWGGEKHSVHLIDTKSKKVYGQVVERISVVGRGAYTFGKANPTNRARTLILGLAEQVWGIT